MKHPTATIDWKWLSGTACLLSAVLLSTSANAYDHGDVKKGEAIFNGTCIACHGADGKGAIPGTPDFTKKDGVLSQSEKELESRIRNGYQSSGSPMAMPPRGGNPSLTDEQIRDVAAYLHSHFHKMDMNMKM
jgi:mono/diheme cytochrome c family protein